MINGHSIAYQWILFKTQYFAFVSIVQINIPTAWQENLELIYAVLL